MCIYVCMYECTYVCMYLCMCSWISTNLLLPCHCTYLMSLKYIAAHWKYMPNYQYVLWAYTPSILIYVYQNTANYNMYSIYYCHVQACNKYASQMPNMPITSHAHMKLLSLNISQMNSVQWTMWPAALVYIHFTLLANVGLRQLIEEEPKSINIGHPAFFANIIQSQGCFSWMVLP